MGIHAARSGDCAPIWRPAPEKFILAPGRIHIFRLALSLEPAQTDALAGLLSPDEQERARRYHFEQDRRRFTAARGQLRQILAACLGVTARELRFDYNPQGKPGLAGSSGVTFNLSHSGGLGLLAVTSGADLGIDIEAHRPEIDRGNISRRFFAQAEWEILAALPQEQQMAGFYNCWTRKEAYIKARGLGLNIGLGRFIVSLAPGVPAELLAREPGAPEGVIQMLELQPGPGFTAALAVMGTIDQVCLWDWKAR